MMPVLSDGAPAARAQDYVAPGDSREAPLPGSLPDDSEPPMTLPRDTNHNANRDTNMSANRDGNFAALLSGRNAPLSLKMNDLRTGWRRMTITAPTQNNDMRQAFAWAETDNFGGRLLDALGVAPGTYFSRGQTVAVGGDSFLIAYRVRFTPDDLDDMPKNDPGVARATEILTRFFRSRTLDLSLLNLKNIGNLSDIRPFSIETQAASLQAMMKDSAKEAIQNQNLTSISNLKQLGLGLIQYTQDYDDVLPLMQNATQAKKAIFPYVKSDDLFLQPGSKTPYRTNPILSRKKLAHISDSARMVAFYEDKPGSDGLRGVLFLDGHAKRLTDKEWRLFKRGSKIK